MASVADDLLFPLEDLHGALGNLHGTRRNGFLQAFWVRKIDVRKSLAFVDLDFFDSAEDLQSLLNKGFRYALRWVGMLQESLTARSGRR
jgi:hypothetical protein